MVINTGLPPRWETISRAIPDMPEHVSVVLDPKVVDTLTELVSIFTGLPSVPAVPKLVPAALEYVFMPVNVWLAVRDAPPPPPPPAAKDGARLAPLEVRTCPEVPTGSTV